eukprot:superscaffoldBa00001024_g8568
MPSKPAKYGIKIWVAFDPQSSYAWEMQVYTGKLTSGGPEKNQGMRVVLDVTDGLRGCNVTCYNFFTSYELSQQLLRRKVTVRIKNVVLLNTLHKTAEISDLEDRKSTIILNYNHNKGGMDNLDKVMGTYSCRRMTAHWIIFHYIIDVSSHKAFMTWIKLNLTRMPDKQNKRKVFL